MKNRGREKPTGGTFQKSHSFTRNPRDDITTHIVRSTTFPPEDTPWGTSCRTCLPEPKPERKLPTRPPLHGKDFPNRKSLREDITHRKLYSPLPVESPRQAYYPVTKSFSCSGYFPEEKTNLPDRGKNVLNSRSFANRLSEETDGWLRGQIDSESIDSDGYPKSIRYDSRFESMLSPESEKNSVDVWYETSSEYELEKNLMAPFESEESDSDRFYMKSRKFFDKSTETFLNNSLTNIKNNNLPFAEIQTNNFLRKNDFYEKMENPLSFYESNKKNIYSYYVSNDANNNDKVSNLKITKLSIPSSKRPLGLASSAKPEMKQLNNGRNYFFANRLMVESAYLNAYNNKNMLYNFLFSKGKNSNKNYQVNSIARPLCFSVAR